MLANYHTHTPRCNHAKGSEREFIEKAIQEGFKVLGFSDHSPQPFEEEFYSWIRMRMSELPDYTETLVKLREEYKKDIQILIGYEVEYSRKYFPALMEELKKFPLDYLIQGQHFAPNEVEGMETGLFTYLAHPDLVNYTGPDEIFCKHMKRIIEKSIELDIPLEVNMYGFSDGRNYPCDRFFRMAKDMGAKFVLGCDAHQTLLLRQPENTPGLSAFLEKHGIDTGDNFVEIKDPHAAWKQVK